MVIIRKIVFSRKPHAQRKTNLRGVVIRDIKRGIPPASRLNDLNLLEGAIWDMLEHCWRAEPSVRPTAQRILDRTAPLCRPATLLSSTHGVTPEALTDHDTAVREVRRATVIAGLKALFISVRFLPKKI
jgi:hypothetical protein